MRKGLVVVLAVVLSLSLTGCLDKIPFIGELFASFPDIEGTWELTLRLEETTCPVDQLGDITLPYEVKGKAEIERNDDQVTIRLYDEQGRLVLEVKGTIDKDGDFNVSGPYLEDVNVDVDFNITGTFSEDEVEGQVKATIKAIDYNFTCSASGSFWGRKVE